MTVEAIAVEQRRHQPFLGEAFLDAGVHIRPLCQELCERGVFAQVRGDQQVEAEAVQHAHRDPRGEGLAAAGDHRHFFPQRIACGGPGPARNRVEEQVGEAEPRQVLGMADGGEDQPDGIDAARLRMWRRLDFVAAPTSESQSTLPWTSVSTAIDSYLFGDDAAVEPPTPSAWEARLARGSASPRRSLLHR